MILCCDYLALGSPLWPVKNSIKYTPIGWGIGCFHDVFGNKTIPNLRAHLDSGKFDTVRVHLEYNKAHKLISMEKLKRVLPAYVKLAQQYQTVNFFISHTCEYYASRPANKRLEYIRSASSRLHAVDCPAKCEPDHNFFTESHDWNAPHRAIYSTDGADIADIGPREYVETCRQNGASLCFIWAPGFNLKKSAFDTTPIARRAAAPTAKYLRQTIALVR